MVMVREGRIGERVNWERNWAEHEFVMEGAMALQVTLLIPIWWMQIGILTRFQHYRVQSVLPDITPGLFPVFKDGKAQKDKWN
jgi:hypothetical protein